MDLRIPTYVDRNLEEFQRAAVRIQRLWRAKQYKKQFDYLKHAICVAELSLSQDIVRILNPVEKELLKDPSLKTKVKIRFGGTEFPPIVLFKVYTSMAPTREGRGLETKEGSESGDSDPCKKGVGSHFQTVPGRGGHIQYITGHKMITPNSKAAEDALRQMGGKQYRHQVAEDSSRQEQLKVTGEVDVTSVKDYMLYMSNTDESPAYVGGKDNTWRKLDLSAWHRPRGTYVLDRRKKRYKREGHVSLPGVSRLADRSRSTGESRRKSRQAMRRADQMRTVYSKGSEGAGLEEVGLKEAGGEDDDDGLDDQAAYDMIQWSQTLNCNDI